MTDVDAVEVWVVVSVIVFVKVLVVVVVGELVGVVVVVGLSLRRCPNNRSERRSVFHFQIQWRPLRLRE